GLCAWALPPSYVADRFAFGGPYHDSVLAFLGARPLRPETSSPTRCPAAILRAARALARRPHPAQYLHRDQPRRQRPRLAPAGGPGSLRQAVLDANAHPGADLIQFAPGLHGTLTLTSGELAITDSVDISGPGANELGVSGNNASRIFEIAAGLNVTITGLTITH